MLQSKVDAAWLTPAVDVALGQTLAMLGWLSVSQRTVDAAWWILT